MARALVAAGVLGAASPAAAQAFTAYGGILRTEETGEHAIPWALEYTTPVREPLGMGLLYLNQGHIDAHHRDGLAAQLWLRTPQTSHGVMFRAGVGPFYFFDTATEGSGYANRHGTGVVYSVAADWQMHNRWYVALHATHVHTRHSFDTSSVMLGVGYHWEKGITEEEPPPGVPVPPAREIDAMLGRTVVNSFDSEHSVAVALEYRRSLRRWADWTITAINEGDARVIRRNGIASQFWLVRRAHDDRVALAFGLGPYIAIDNHEHAVAEGGRERLAGLVSFSARYSFTPRWHVRVTWSRVLADYSRDTDIFLAGVGYGF